MRGKIQKKSRKGIHTYPFLPNISYKSIYLILNVRIPATPADWTRTR